jgi:hypothetical protein
MQLLTLSLITFDVAAAVATTLLTCGGYPDTSLAQIAALNVLEVCSFVAFLTYGTNSDTLNKLLYRWCRHSYKIKSYLIFFILSFMFEFNLPIQVQLSITSLDDS